MHRSVDRKKEKQQPENLLQPDATTRFFRNEVYINDNLTTMRSEAFAKYKGFVGLIYIDPPYNTLSSKSYNDKHDSGSWCDYMRVRLTEAKKFLRDDAIILISIDDNEYAHLKICCDEVFGASNFIGTLITKQAQRSNAKLINVVHEYILCYAKNKSKVKSFSIRRMDIPEERHMIVKLQQEITETMQTANRSTALKKLKTRIKELCEEYDITWLRNYSSLDDEGKIFFAVDLSTPGVPREVNLPEIDLHLEPLPTRGWATDARFIELHKQNRLAFKNGRPYSIRYLDESEDNIPSVLNFYSRQGTHDLKRLGLQGIFDTPKPVEMLKFFIRMANVHDSYILDFFAGSGSTAQAVYETNAEDNRNNNFLLIQLPEKVNTKSESYKKCLAFNINPTIDEILKLRLETYLKSKNSPIDFTIIH